MCRGPTLRRVTSPGEIVDLKRVPSFSSLSLLTPSVQPSGFCFDGSKRRGHRYCLSWFDATSSMLSLRQNEYWNVLTDLLPALFFSCCFFIFVCSAEPLGINLQVTHIILWDLVRRLARGCL